MNYTNRLLTEEEAAEYFGWSLAKQRELRKLGLIKYYQFNDQTIRYSLEQLEDFQTKYAKSASVEIAEK